jgi:hypothetical protein
LFQDAERICALVQVIRPEICQVGSAYDTARWTFYSTNVTVYIILCGFPPVFSDPKPMLR